MKSIIVELRDRGTCIPAMVTELSLSSGEDDCENKLIKHCGYGISPMYLLTKLNNGESHNSPYKWDLGSRTMFEAHKYICENFYNLKSGDVIDVEFILGETQTPKTSDIL